MAVFAALWWIIGTAASHRGSLPMYAAGAVISSIIAVIGIRIFYDVSKDAVEVLAIVAKSQSAPQLMTSVRRIVRPQWPI
jgi:hypothetical protein